MSSPNIRTHIAHKKIIPSLSDLVLDCGNCGSRLFNVHVRPILNRGRVVELVCKKCLKVFKIDDQGMLDGDGKVTIHGGSSNGSSSRPS